MMLLFRPRSLTLPVAFALFVLSLSCDVQPHVNSTIPKSQAEDVPTRSIIAVRLSNSVTDKDTSAIDPKNFVVTGDLTQGSYPGTLSLADHDTLSDGMTVEEFQQSQTANAADANAGAANTKDKTAKKVLKDTIVFLLPQGTSFKEGEMVHVSVSNKVTSHSSPLSKRKTFSFRVRGSAGATGDLRVTATDPSPGESLVSARPRISATFNRAVKGDGLADAITVRGAQSGVHAGGETVFSRTSGTNQVLEVVRRLAADDAFVPGESVDTTWSSAVTDATAGQGTAAHLVPYLLAFQVQPGLTQEGWTPIDPPAAAASPIALLAADFRPSIAGVEVAVVSANTISLYSQTGSHIWTRTDSEVLLEDGSGTFSIVDGAVYDTKDDGNPEVVLLLSSDKGSRLVTYELGESGSFSLTGKPTDFPIVQPGRMTLADLDANGKPEIVLSHPSTSYIPAAGGIAKKTGSVTFVELKLLPPDVAEIDPSDPATLLPKPGFAATHDAIQGFTRSQRIELADLNNDGKLDLISETSSGLELFRNIGSPTASLAFKSAQKLSGRSTKSLEPLAWVVLDADGDGDQDILAWDAQGALLYRNRQVSSDVPSGSASVPAGLLTENLAPEPSSALPVLSQPARVRALELNGDGILDLVLERSDGGLTFLLGNDSAAISFQAVEQSTPGSSAGLAIADFDGDTGLDVGVVSSSNGAARFFLSQGVDAPSMAAPSSFQLAPDGGGFTDLTGDKIQVGVLGNLTEKFTGFSIALDYDESLLTYNGFDIPEVLGRKGSFTLCPDDKLQGCTGSASARMVYQQNTQGAPADGLLLGTFKFKRKTVTAAKTTKIELKSFTGPNNTTFNNTLSVVEGTATVSLPVEIEGDPIELVLQPPAPPDLEAQCTVLSRDDASLSGRVTWSSPSGALFTQFQVTVGGGAPTVLPGSATFLEFTSSLTGPINVTVATQDASARPVSASCQIIGIHRPSVTCVAVEIGKQNHVTWSLSHPVDRFVIYRNGVRLTQTASGIDTEYVDTSPSKNGADNYEVAGVLAGIEGPRGSCAGGPVGDPDTNNTLPPVITEATLLARQLPADPNVLRCRWANGEGYTSVSVTLEKVGEAAPIVSQNLPGTSVEFVAPGDAARGGIKPGQYVFTVTGKAGAKSSETQRSSQINVGVPVLAASFTCTVDISGSIRAVWQPVWPGYSSLKLFIEHRIDGNLDGTPEEIPLDFLTTNYTVSGHAPTGVYTLRLAASYTDALPPALQPKPENMEKSCEVSFTPRIHVGREKGGVGISGIPIPVKADFFGLVKGFHFELEYPAFFDVDPDPMRGLLVEYPGATRTFSIQPGSSDLTKKAVVTVSDVEIATDADGTVVLASIVGSLPLDFNLPSESPLFFTGPATLNFGELGDTSLATDDEGALLVKKRFVRLDTGSVAVGSSEAVPLLVHSTFSAPASAPNYRLNAFQLHLTWDPTLVELLPVTQEDQKQTVLYDSQKKKFIGSFFLPTDASLAAGNATGDLQVSWLGFDFTNVTQQFFLYPGVDLTLLVTRFRSKVPGDSPAVFAAIDFVKAPRADHAQDLATAFFPEVDVPSEPDLDGFFGGGIEMLSTVAPFTVTSIVPSQGSLLGGNEAVISGSGFRPAGSSTSDVHIQLVRAAPGGALALPVTEVIDVQSSTIRFRVPDSGLRNPTVSSTFADVQVTLGSATNKLVHAYSFEFPRLTSADATSVRAAGGDLLVIRGAGLAPVSTAAFRLDGVAEPFSAQVTKVDSDGTRLFLTTPALTGQAGNKATVEVTVPGVATVSLASKLDIAGSGGPTFKLDSVSPLTGTICGGDTVTLKGDGFLTTLTVQFGTIPARSVDVVDSKTARAVTPAVPEGTAVVSVAIANATGPTVTKQSAFTFQQLAPAFKRGDVDQSGRIDFVDATTLSDLLLGKSRSFPANLDAADANDDGIVNGGDVTAILNHLFGGVPALPSPFATPGLDPTSDSITSCGP